MCFDAFYKRRHSHFFVFVLDGSHGEVEKAPFIAKPVRLTPAWEANNLPNDELNFRGNIPVFPFCVHSVLHANPFSFILKSANFFDSIWTFSLVINHKFHKKNSLHSFKVWQWNEPHWKSILRVIDLILYILYYCYTGSARWCHGTCLSLPIRWVLICLCDALCAFLWFFINFGG